MLKTLYSSVLNHLTEPLAHRVSRNVVDSIRDQGLVAAPAVPQLEVVPANTRIDLDYPTSVENAPRWGHGRPVHGRLSQLLDRTADEQSERFEALRALAPIANEIPELAADGDARPRWRNPMMAGLDGVLMGGMLAHGPRQYIEVGSGNSTKFARHFIQKLGLKTTITSIDPYPRAEIDGLCDEVLRTPVEAIAPSTFDRLEPGDVLFFDGSHRSFMNSDVTMMLLEVIPALKPGVIVGIHDIFWPEDYSLDWAPRYYSEQYVLGAWLVGAEDRVRVLFPTHAFRLRDTTGERLRTMAGVLGCPPDAFHGCSFWFTREHGNG